MFVTVVCLLAGATISWQTCHADIFNITSFRDLYYTQTSDTAVATSGAAFVLGLSEGHVGDYSAVSVTYPGPGSPLSIPYFSFPGSQAFNYYSPTYATKAEMDAAFPGGSYVFNASGGTAAAATATVDYPTSDYYSPSIPMLAGSTFDNLQSLDPNQPCNVQFNTFVLNPSSPGVHTGFLGFVVYNYPSHSAAFYQTSLPPSTSMLTIPAGTLLPNHEYEFTLGYDNSIYFPSSGASYDTRVGFDNVTSGLFTTVPEPSSATLMLAAALACGICYCRRFVRFRDTTR